MGTTRRNCRKNDRLTKRCTGQAGESGVIQNVGQKGFTVVNKEGIGSVLCSRPMKKGSELKLCRVKSRTSHRRNFMKLPFAMTIIFTLTGCATIVNDSHIPLAVSFSDGSAGQCNFKNKRGTWTSEIPTTNVMIRRSDDALNYDCSTADGRDATGSIRSEMEGGKLAASVVFFDFGITDAITDKHRTYQGNLVIPVSLRKPSS